MQLDGRYFVCPSTRDTPATGPTTQAVIAELAKGGHCSYIYVGRGMTTATATSTTVVAYEPLVNHGNGADVLFGDGHVQFMLAPQFKSLIATIPATTFPTTQPIQ